MLNLAGLHRRISAYVALLGSDDSVSLLSLAEGWGCTQEYLAHVFDGLGFCLHHELVEDKDGTVTRDEWFAARLGWVNEYHRSGGIWGYDDMPPAVAVAAPVDPRAHAKVCMTVEEATEIWSNMEKGRLRPVSPKYEAMGIADRLHRYFRVQNSGDDPADLKMIRRSLHHYRCPTRRDWLSWKIDDESCDWGIIETTGLFDEDFELVYEAIYTELDRYPTSLTECPPLRDKKLNRLYRLDMRLQMLANFHRTVWIDW